VIKEALNKYGYDDNTIKSGRTLYEEADTLHRIQVREYGAQQFITDDLVEARANANINYLKHLRLARIALKDLPEVIQVLWNVEIKSFSLFGWMKQVEDFYNRLLQSTIDQKKALDKVGLDDAILCQGLDNMKSVERLLNEQLKEDGEAHNSTKKRDAAFDVMNTWVIDFIEVASIALDTKPQYLEIMGACSR
jgi:hypothetical protein